MIWEPLVNLWLCERGRQQRPLRPTSAEPAETQLPAQPTLSLMISDLAAHDLQEQA